MKNKILSCLIVLIMCACPIVLIGCGSDPYVDAEKYETASIEFVDIMQITKTEYKVEVTLPSGTYSDVDVYFSFYDRIKSTDEKLEHTLNGNKIAFDLTAEEGDYFLIIHTAGFDFIMPITIPKMTPFMSLRTMGDDVYAEIDYSIEGKSSWSSFIDPTGKNVYKSSKKVFDETAVAVKAKIPITEKLTNDLGYSSEMPYYYIVFNGKNGRLRFTTFALTTSAFVFSNLKATLKANASGIPILQVEAVKINSDESFKLLVRSGDEKYYADIDNGTYTLSLTSLLKDGIWYDILLEETKTKQQYNLVKKNAANMSASVNYASRIFKLAEYENDLKVYFEIN